MPVGKAVIGQSGGPTAVINKSLVGFIKEAINQEYDEILGVRHGPVSYTHLTLPTMDHV